MIIVMKSSAPPEEIDSVEHRVRKLEYVPHKIVGVERTIIGAVGDERGKERLHALESMPGVESVSPILKPYKLASREVRPENSVIDCSGHPVGGKALMMVAGPFSVESKEQICSTAQQVKSAGANFYAWRRL